MAGRAPRRARSRPPRAAQRAYDSALSNCRELGGYWTGSSCRASERVEPLACPPGWAWSSEVGECQWDGGALPALADGSRRPCMTDLACRGGSVRMSRRGYPVCDCPAGAVTWGNYPRLSCVPSVARIAPLLIGGSILGVNQGRPQFGQVYGNKRFCGPGKTGTPPNCVVAQSCPSPLVGTPPNCTGAVQLGQGCPVGTTYRVGGNIGRCVPDRTPAPTPVSTATPVPTPIATPTPTPTGVPARACLNNETISNGCRCELPMRPMPNGTCFATPGAGQACLDGQNMSSGCQCLLQKFDVAGGSICATRAPGAGTTTVCAIGQTNVNGVCTSLNNSITCTGGKIEQGVCGCPTGTALSGGGRNFQCVATGGGVAPTPMPTPTPTGTTTTPVCAVGQTAVNGVCVNLNDSITCTGGRVEQGVCGCPSGTSLTGSGRSFRCVAAAPTPTPTPTPAPVTGGGVTGGGQTGTQTTTQSAICKQGDDIAATKCTCNMNTVDAGGGKFICSSVTYTTCTDGQLMTGSGCKCRMKTVKVGNDLYCTVSGKAPLVGGASCTEGQSTAGGCRCVLPLVDLPGGRCGKPTRGGACLEGQNIVQTGCNCTAPLKPIENGVCGRLC